jgi:iron complex outermembrane receptor protein
MILYRVAVLLLQASAAPDASEPPDTREIQELSLEDLLNQRVDAATKSESVASQVPAVVTVLTADDIQARGYTSLADILRSVPGFYDVYDFVTHNIGVRGINGGQNASGSVIKLMIDGHAVDYRPTTGNFFGEELIPIQAIERVEIIRGPASALYGANAFLGAINVVTKSGAASGTRAIGQGTTMRGHAGGGGGAVLGASAGPVDVLLAAQYLVLDRSGLGAPASSPLSIQDRGVSQSDRARPGTLFAKVAVDEVLRGKLTFMASIQSLDAAGEYQSFGPLLHDSRITQLNQNYRLSYRVQPIESLSFVLSGHYFNSAPTGAARFDTGQPGSIMLPSAGAAGPGLSAEAHFKPIDFLGFVGGVDHEQASTQVETYDQKLVRPVLAPDGTTLRSAGTIIPGQDHGDQIVFRNTGAFLQGVLTPTPEWTGIAGVRLDAHNIYGVKTSARGGIVYSADALSLKLLYGSSFKAPSAEQLYTQPVAFGGILGNPKLDAQTAHNIELAAGLRLPDGWGEVEVNGYATNVSGRVEFLPSGSYVVANNLQSEWIVGGELASRFVLAPPLRLHVLAGVSENLPNTPDPALLGKPDVPMPLFPNVQVHVIADYRLPWWSLRAISEVSYIGARSASFSNALIRGDAYRLSPYVYTSAALSRSAPLLLSDRETSIVLRVTNPFNLTWAEPGFGGIDIPNPGISFSLTLVQEL